jgi:c-di-GMP-binding flagellar brake protein YcgR
MNLPNYQPSTPLAAPAERRRDPRYTVRVQIELRQDGSDVPLRLETTDLSRGGCYIQLMMTLPIATYVDITLWLDDIPVRIRGRVVTRHPQFGNGIMFLEFKDNGEHLLTRYLSAITV